MTAMRVSVRPCSFARAIVTSSVRPCSFARPIVTSSTVRPCSLAQTIVTSSRAPRSLAQAQRTPLGGSLARATAMSSCSLAPARLRLKSASSRVRSCSFARARMWSEGRQRANDRQPSPKVIRKVHVASTEIAPPTLFGSRPCLVCEHVSDRLIVGEGWRPLARWRPSDHVVTRASEPVRNAGGCHEHGQTHSLSTLRASARRDRDTRAKDHEHLAAQVNNRRAIGMQVRAPENA